MVVLILRWVRRFSGFTRVLLGESRTGGVGVLVYLAIFSFADIASSLGRDSTLTGRTDVWPAILEQIDRRPVLGLGWNGAWHEGLPDTQRMWRAAGFKMYHSHDGYLDILMQIGIVGLLLMSAALLCAIFLGIRSYVVSNDEISGWTVASVVALLLVNLTESPATNFFGMFVLISALLLATKPAACVSGRHVRVTCAEHGEHDVRSAKPPSATTSLDELASCS